MNPDDFLKAHPPKVRQSRLTPAWPAIQKMRAAGSPLADIKIFLEQNGITTSLPNLSLFIKRQMQKDQEKPETGKLGSTGNDAESEQTESSSEQISDSLPTDQASGEAGETPEERFKRLKRQEAQKKYDRFKPQ